MESQDTQETKNSFTPDNLNISDILPKISTLKDGEYLRISHAFSIFKIGGKTIGIDPSVQGRQYLNEKGKLIPPGSDNAFMSIKPRETEYTWEMIHAEPEAANDKVLNNTQRVGKYLAPYIDYFLISHLDADHLDFELIRSAMENNPNLNVYGPLGWQKFIYKYHTLESDDSKFPQSGPNLPRDIEKRLHGLSPKHAIEGKDVGLSFKGLNLNEIDLSQGRGLPKIKSFDIPHAGAITNVEYVQGFLLEDENNRILYLPDSALSPEIITIIRNLHNEKKLTRMLISIATMGSESFYGIDPKIADKLRENIEEPISHSAYLPLIAIALTDSETPVDVIHHGFFYRSRQKKSLFRHKYPIPKNTDSIEPNEWLNQFKSYIQNCLDTMQGSINKLGPDVLSFGKQGRTSVKRFIGDLFARSKFSNQIVNWIKTNGVPDGIINKINIPEAGKIVH